MEKYHKSDICPIEKENERGEDYEAANTCIDRSRTKNNYRLLFRKRSYTDFINARLVELNLPKKPRKDAVLMVSFVVGSGGEFFQTLTGDEQCRFFRDCADYFINRYGRKNIISAVVHNDETTPHMHLNLIPVKDGKLCAKELFGRKELFELQTDFYEKTGKHWGLKRGKEGSVARHLSTAEFKAKCIVDKAITTSTEIIANAEDKAKTEMTALNVAVQKADEHFEKTMKNISAAKEEKNKILAERNAEADYNRALEEAKQGKFAFTKSGLKNQIVALTAELKRAENESERQKNDNQFLFNECRKLNKDKDRFEKMNRIYSLFRDKEPEAFARVFYRATALFETFIPKNEQIADLGKSRLREIEEEIEREKENAAKTTSEDYYSKSR